jgi:hypothetical protein
MSIKIDKATVSLMAGMTLPELPASDELYDLIFKTALLDESEDSHGALKGLVDAYIALVSIESDFEDLELVSDGHGKDKSWNAEKVYMKFIMAGFRSKLPDFKKASDEETYESCTAYFWENISWPPKLLAEVSFARGVRDAIDCKALRDYMRQQQAAS